MIRHLNCGKNLNWLLNLNLIYQTLSTGVGSGLLISILEKLTWFLLTGLITMLTLMWKLISLFLNKNNLLKSSKLDSCITSIAKTASKKTGALICSMKFLSSEVVLYLYKSTLWPCMEYCCHVRVGACSCYLELLEKLQKRICKTVGPSLAASLKPLSHPQNVVSLSLFYRYYFSQHCK